MTGLCKRVSVKREEFESLLVERHTRQVHERLRKTTSAIAGLGGLGSAVAIALCRMGIGKLIVADCDSVELSNIHRQRYIISQIGMAKVDAIEQTISEINPYVEIIKHRVILTKANIPRIFGSADIVIECLDQPEAKAMLIQTVAEFLPDTYVIGASGIAGYGNNNKILTHRLGEKIYIVGDLVSEVKPGQPLMAGRVGIAAHHQANLVVSLLMGVDNDVVEC